MPKENYGPFTGREKTALAEILKNYPIRTDADYLGMLVEMQRWFGRLDFAAIDEVSEVIRADCRIVALDEAQLRHALKASGQDRAEKFFALPVIVSVGTPISVVGQLPKMDYFALYTFGGSTNQSGILTVFGITLAEHKKRLAQAGMPHFDLASGIAPHTAPLN